MSEKAPYPKNEHDKRPLGRFLLSRTQEFLSEKFDYVAAYNYAKDFSVKYIDELHSSGISSIAKIDVGDEEAGTYDKKNYLWLEFDHRFAEAHCYVWKLNGTHEHTDLVLSDSFFLVTQYELSQQNAVLRRLTSDDSEQARRLQSVVEAVLDRPQFRASIEQKRLRRSEQQLDYDRLVDSSKNTPLSLRESRNLEILRKTKSLPLFDTGFIDRRDQLPLIGRYDWRPAPILDFSQQPRVQQ